MRLHSQRAQVLLQAVVLKDCVGEWSDYGECKLDAGVGLNTRCRLYNIVVLRHLKGVWLHAGLPVVHHQRMRQATPPSPEGSNSSHKRNLVDGEGSERMRTVTARIPMMASRRMDKKRTESAEDGSALGESEEDKGPPLPLLRNGPHRRSCAGAVAACGSRLRVPQAEEEARRCVHAFADYHPFPGLKARERLEQAVHAADEPDVWPDGQS